jgi:hypothetical protein
MRQRTDSGVLVMGSGRGKWLSIAGAFHRGCEALAVTRAADVDGALAIAAVRQPDVALVEAAAWLPVAPLVAGLNAACPACSVALLGDLLPKAEHARVRRHRFRAYILWGDLGSGGVPELVRVIRQVPYLLVSEAVVAQARTLDPEVAPAGAATLRERQILVLRALLARYRVCEIEGATGIPQGSVGRMVCELKELLDAPTLSMLAIRARELGLTPLEGEHAPREGGIGPRRTAAAIGSDRRGDRKRS